MESVRSLRERSFMELLGQATAARVEGVAVLRCGEGLRHGVWLQQGYVVGCHVAGHFDPLLDLLRRRGALSASSHGACLRALAESPRRAGSVALEVASLAPEEVADAVRAQLIERFRVLLAVAERRGHDSWLERRSVPDHEASARMPLGSLLRRVERPSGGRERERPWPGGDATPLDGALTALRGRPDAPQEARRRLRALALALHPDRHGELDAEQQKSLSDTLAKATACYHGFT